jgi:hypothetical protein
VPEDVYKRQKVIRLKTLKGVAEDMVMQANTDKDFEEWLYAFKSFATKIDQAKNHKIKHLDIKKS